MADTPTRAELVHHDVRSESVPEYDATPSSPDVVVNEDTGKVEHVTLDRHVSADGPLAVQVPPEADGSTGNTLGVLGEPSPEEVFADDHSESESHDDPYTQ